MTQGTIRTGKLRVVEIKKHVLSVPLEVMEDVPCEVPGCAGVSTHRVQHLCCELTYDLCPAHLDHMRGAFEREAHGDTELRCENCGRSPLPRPVFTPFYML